MSFLKCIKLENERQLVCCDYDIHNNTIVGKIGYQPLLGIWDANSGELIKKLENTKFQYTDKLALSPDGTMIVTDLPGNSLGIWDADSGTLICSTPKQWQSVSSVAFNPDSTNVASGSRDVVRIFDANLGTLVSEMPIKSGSAGRYVNSVAFSPDGTKIVSGSSDNTVRIWDAIAGTLVSTLQGHSRYVNSVAFSPDGTKIVSGSRDNTVRIWDAIAGTLLNTLQGNSSSVRLVAFSPDGTKIVSGSGDRTMRIWETNSGREINRFDIESRPLIVKFSEDGSEFYVVEENNNVCTFSVLSESNITDIKTLLGPAVKARENRVNNKLVTPNLSTLSEALSTSGVRNTLLSSLYGKDYNQQKVYDKLLNPYYRRYPDFSRSIPSEALPGLFGQDELPLDTKLGKEEEEIDGGKKSKKTRRYKKNKSKRRYKKNKSKRRYKK
jgi:WD40 repeat protein